jgi:methylphosphotriester-DNA--protein-cysteine methyltransferase
MELPNREICYRALQSRDARFDGLLFVGVTSTGIYCRPVCPARTARFENCRFFGSAAAAQEAGFRPCLRCRPETAPDLASWRGTSNTVSRALALIADGDGAAISEMDAFPASDIGLLRGAAKMDGMDGTRSTAAGLLNRAEVWRPWCAYAAQHLWAADASAISNE